MSHDARADGDEDRPVYRRKPVVYGDDGFPVVSKYRQRTWEGLRWSEQRAPSCEPPAVAIAIPIQR